MQKYQSTLHPAIERIINNQRYKNPKITITLSGEDLTELALFLCDPEKQNTKFAETLKQRIAEYAE